MRTRAASAASRARRLTSGSLRAGTGGRHELEETPQLVVRRLGALGRPEGDLLRGLRELDDVAVLVLDACDVRLACSSAARAAAKTS